MIYTARNNNDWKILMHKTKSSYFSTGKAPNDLWSSRVKPSHIQHAGIVGVCDSKLCGAHGTYNQPGIDASSLSVLLESLGWVYPACPCLIVRVDNEDIHVEFFLLGIDHWLGTVSRTHGDLHKGIQVLVRGVRC